MRYKSFLVFAAAALAGGIAAPVVADVTGDDAAKYRQSIMRALSGHNNAVSLIAREKAGDPASLEHHTASMVALAGEIEAAFAAGGGAPAEDTEALPAIWEEPDAFAAKVDKFVAAVDDLDAAAAGGDLAAVDSAQRDVGAACKGCHEDFRLDD